MKALKVANLTEENDIIIVHHTSDDDENIENVVTDTEQDIESSEELKEEEEEIYMSEFESDEMTMATTIQKLRAISKAVNFPQNRILAFANFCSSAKVKPLRPIRDQATRWSATFNMLERAVYLRTPIDLWTRSNVKYEKLRLSDKEWDMAEFLLRFLRPFTIINTLIQGTSKASLQETWVKYEEMFDCLEVTKTALEGLEHISTWLQDIQEAIQAIWKKLSKYYTKTDRPFTFVDATLLHPALKLQFMKKSGYGDDKIKQYEDQA